MRKYLFIALIILSVPLMAQDGGGIDIGDLLAVVFGILTSIFGPAFIWFKRKSKKLANFGLQSMEAGIAANNLVQHHVKAIEDGKVDKEEQTGYVTLSRAVAKETGEAVQAFRVLFKKDPTV